MSELAELISEAIDATSNHVELIDRVIAENAINTCVYCGEVSFKGFVIENGQWSSVAKQAMADHVLGCPKRPEKKLLNIIDTQKAALTFCRDLAEEELGFQRVGTGAEVALRHIARKAREAIATITAPEAGSGDNNGS